MLVPITVAFIFARQQHHHRSRTTAAHWAAQPPRRPHLPPPSWERKSPKHRSSTSRVAISPSSCVMGNNKLWVKMRNGLCTKHTTSMMDKATPPGRVRAHTHTQNLSPFTQQGGTDGHVHLIRTSRARNAFLCTHLVAALGRKHSWEIEG